MLIRKEFFKNMKINKMLLRIAFVKLWNFCLFSKTIWGNTEVENKIMLIKKINI